MSDALVFMAGAWFVWLPPRSHPLNSWIWWARGFVFLGLMWTVQSERECLSEHCTDGRLKHTPRLSVKGAYWLVLDF